MCVHVQAEDFHEKRGCVQYTWMYASHHTITFNNTHVKTTNIYHLNTYRAAEAMAGELLDNFRARLAERMAT